MHHRSESTLSDPPPCRTNFSEYISYHSEKTLLFPLDAIYECNSVVRPCVEVEMKCMPKTAFSELPCQCSICQCLLATRHSLAGRLVQNFLHLVAPSRTQCTSPRTRRTSYKILIECRTCSFTCTMCVQTNG